MAIYSRAVPIRPGRKKCKLSWNDPKRLLYPNHAEFWPAEVPESVVFAELDEARARAARRRVTRLFFRRLLRSAGDIVPLPKRAKASRVKTDSGKRDAL